MMNRSELNFEVLGKRVVCRLPRIEDHHELLQFFLRNRKFFETHQPNRGDRFYTKENILSFIEEQREKYPKDKGCMFLVFQQKNRKEIIGTINFFNIIRGGFQACMLGFQLDESHQGQGLMTESLEIAMAHVFDELNIHRIMANVRPENERSVNLLKNLRFEFEGYSKEYLRVNGKWVDYYNTSKINGKWSENGR